MNRPRVALLAALLLPLTMGQTAVVPNGTTSGAGLGCAGGLALPPIGIPLPGPTLGGSLYPPDDFDLGLAPGEGSPAGSDAGADSTIEPAVNEGNPGPDLLSGGWPGPRDDFNSGPAPGAGGPPGSDTGSGSTSEVVVIVHELPEPPSPEGTWSFGLCSVDCWIEFIVAADGTFTGWQLLPTDDPHHRPNIISVTVSGAITADTVTLEATLIEEFGYIEFLGRQPCLAIHEVKYTGGLDGGVYHVPTEPFRTYYGVKEYKVTRDPCVPPTIVSADVTEWTAPGPSIWSDYWHASFHKRASP